jgi:hypothetical protein
VREQGGLRALFKGIEPTAVRVFFGAGIYFAALQGIADALGVGTGRGDGGRTSGPDATTAAAAAAAAAPASPPPYAGARTFFAGVAARSIAAAILSPVAVVKTRIEWADARTAPIGGGGTAAAVRHIVRTEGWASLFSGLVPTIVRDAPFSGLYYTSYSQLKEALGTPAAVAAIPLPLVRNFIAGLGAGALATIITHPADVLKTRLQLKVRGGRGGKGGGEKGGPGAGGRLLLPPVGTLTSHRHHHRRLYLFARLSWLLLTPLLLFPHSPSPQTAGGRFVDWARLSAEARDVVARQGTGGLFVGVGARVAKRALSTAITWTLFEEAMRRSGGGGGG